MMRLLRLSLTVAAASIALVPFEASAQTQCGGGRASNGDCVNETMATMAIETAVIFSQPKVSHTAYPVLPFADRLYRYPNQLISNQLAPTRVTPPPPPRGDDGG
ncbi:MAG TPA: hypothetical protein VLU23_20395 [Pseudolabrys sp.]|jgi:hypothetical protein|nr:hypothetical protein [Pseudolabrys sp.]